ncbi:MAG: abhydrolase domain-containing 18 [Dehalococcoidia bacterium]|nr:MAG: abhydrolase domain-containing 18 [Dehalococcoidia bacterium]
MNPYSYAGGEPRFNLQLKETTSRWLRYRVDFPSAHPTRYEESNTVWGEYFQPRRVEHAPLAILIHGWGDRSVIPCKLLARALVRRGIACFILYLVFHSSRMPEAIRNRLPALSPEEWFEGYRISVINVRQVVDWAAGRADIDKERIAVVGISLCGFISAIAIGIDKRI